MSSRGKSKNRLFDSHAMFIDQNILGRLAHSKLQTFSENFIQNGIVEGLFSDNLMNIQVTPLSIVEFLGVKPFLPTSEDQEKIKKKHRKTN